MMCRHQVRPRGKRGRSSSVAKTAAVPTSIHPRSTAKTEGGVETRPSTPDTVAATHRSLSRVHPSDQAAEADAPLVVAFHTISGWSVGTR